jgi:hypothetical protein
MACMRALMVIFDKLCKSSVNEVAPTKAIAPQSAHTLTQPRPLNLPYGYQTTGPQDSVQT